MSDPLSEQACICLNEPMQSEEYDQIRFIGVDTTNGRFGEVSLWQCRKCGRYWLHYLAEYEASTSSGRVFMGLVTPQIADALSPGDAIGYLDGLDWHLYGGSYFGSRGRSSARISADL